MDALFAANGADTTQSADERHNPTKQRTKMNLTCTTWLRIVIWNVPHP
jgi:hypothetical protein